MQTCKYYVFSLYQMHLIICNMTTNNRFIHFEPTITRKGKRPSYIVDQVPKRIYSKVSKSSVSKYGLI